MKILPRLLCFFVFISHAVPQQPQQPPSTTGQGFVQPLVQSTSSLATMPPTANLPDSAATKTITVLPELFTGTAGYTFPISDLPSRNGMTLNLALRYRSDNGDGPLGLGWQLDFGSIERSTLFGTDFGAKEFLLSRDGLRQTLIEAGSATGEYKAKIQQEYFFLQQATDAQGNPFWMLSDKLGTRYFFGQSSASRQDDPADPSRIFKWCLDRIEDSNGNYLQARYWKNDGQIYLDSVEYGGHGDDLKPTALVVLERETRPDAPPGYSQGFLVRTAFRTRSIKVFHLGPTGNRDLVHSYGLHYNTNTSSSRRTLLDSIVETGKSPTNSPTLTTQIAYSTDSGTWGITAWPGPNTELSGHCIVGNFHGHGATELACLDAPGRGWRISTFLGRPGVVAGGNEVWPNGPNGVLPVTSKCIVGDFNGDGKTDVACHQTNGNWDMALSTGSGWATTSWTGGTPPAGSFGDSCVVGDFNGDSRTDYACHAGGGTWAVSLSSGSGWVASASWAAGVAPEVPFANRCITADLNGDGRADIGCFSSRGAWSVSISDGNKWQATASWGNGPAATVPFSNTCVEGDFNGDGKTDVACQPSPGTWRVSLSTGKGWDTADWQNGPTASLPLSHTVLIGDFNGDGKTDVVAHSGGWGTSCGDQTSSWKDLPAQRQYPELCELLSPACHEVGDVSEEDSAFVEGRFQKRFRAHCSRYSDVWDLRISAGNTWLAPSWGAGLPLLEAAGDKCFVADLSGEARSSIACQTAAQTYTAMLAPGSFPDLLTSVRNPLGGKTRTAYHPTTETAGTQLPFPFQVLESVETDDGNGVVGKTTVDLRRGFFSLPEREFRGFGEVRITRQIDTARPPVAPVVTVQTLRFHQGNSLDPRPDDPTAKDGFMKGRLFAMDISDSTGKRYTATEIAYQPNVGGTGPPYFNPPSQVIKSYLDGPPVTVTERFGYDSFQNVVLEEHDSSDTATVKRSIVTTFILPGSTHIVGLPKTQTVYAAIGLSPSTPFVARKSFFYDDVDSACSKSITPVALVGNVSRVISWIGPDFKKTNDKDPETWTAYDKYGNPTCTRDPKGNIRTFTYDTSKTYVTAISGPIPKWKVGMTYYGIDNPPSDAGAVGVVKTFTDPNTNVTEYRYDGLGRLVRLTRPDLSWQSWSYEALGLPGKQHVRFENSKHLMRDVYFDGFNNTIKERRTGPSGSMITTNTEYYQSGLVKRVSEPSYEDTIDISTQFSYDALGRPVRITAPDGTISALCFNGMSVGTLDGNGHGRRYSTNTDGAIVRGEEFDGVFRNCESSIRLGGGDQDSSTTASGAGRSPVSVGTMTYDVFGKLTAYEDSLLRKTELKYDSLGRLRKFTSADIGVETIDYDPNGNRASVQYPGAVDRQSIFYKYDALDRLIQKDYIQPKPRLSADWEFVYDEARGAGAGRLTTVRKAHIDQSHIYYDSLGRAIKKEVFLNQQYSTTFKYDECDRLAVTTFPNGASFTYDYDGPFVNRVRYSQTGKTLVELTDYTALGQPSKIMYGNGVETDYTYCQVSNPSCPKGNWKTRSIVTKAGTETLGELEYDYDPVGNVVHIAEDSKIDRIYAYDCLDRLIGAGVSNQKATTWPPVALNSTAVAAAGIADTLKSLRPNVSWSDIFQYDAVGNLAFATAVGAFTYPPNGKVPADAPLRVGDVSYTYWSTGATKTRKGPGGVTSFSYNYDNLLESVRKGNLTTEFSYDWAGRRLERSISGGSPTRYLGEGYECNSKGCAASVVIEGKRLATVLGSAAEYYHLDDLGSVRLVTDGQAKVVERVEYAPFGGISSKPKTKRARYVGREYDETSGLYYIGSRYLDPALGRFISPDTSFSFSATSQGWNPYSYAGNNPLAWRDTSGYASERTGWVHVGRGSLAVLAGVAGLLVPETGGVSLAVLAGVTTTMGLSAGTAEVVVGGLQLGGAVASGDAAAVEEGLSTSGGPASLGAELFSTAAGWGTEDREAARGIGESLQSGLEFGKISRGIFSGTPSLRENLTNFAGVGAYLAEKVLPSRATAPDRSSRNGGPRDRPDIERRSPERGPRVSVDWSHEKIDVRPADKPARSEAPSKPEKSQPSHRETGPTISRH